jgi:hypothetical protein
LHISSAKSGTVLLYSTHVVLPLTHVATTPPGVAALAVLAAAPFPCEGAASDLPQPAASAATTIERMGSIEARRMVRFMVVLFS